MRLDGHDTRPVNGADARGPHGAYTSAHGAPGAHAAHAAPGAHRSEEHTSELQSL